MERFRASGFIAFAIGVFCSALFVSNAFAQVEGVGKVRVGVVTFAESDGVLYGGAEVAGLLISELKDSRYFSVADTSGWTPVDAELVASAKDAIDSESAAAFRRRFGAKLILVGNLSEYRQKLKVSMTGVKTYESTVKFSLKAFDLSTAGLTFSKVFDERGISVGDPNKALKDAGSKAAKAAVAALAKRFVP